MPQRRRLQSPAQAERRRNLVGEAIQGAESIGPDPTFGSGMSPQQMDMVQQLAMLGTAGGGKLTGNRAVLDEILKSLIKAETRDPIAPTSSLLSALKGSRRSIPKKTDPEIERTFNSMVNDPTVWRRLFRE